MLDYCAAYLTLPYITFYYFTLPYITSHYFILSNVHLFIVYLTTFSIRQTAQPSVLGRGENAQ